MRWSTDGRLDFEALQRRNRSASRERGTWPGPIPANLMLFDLVRLRDQDLGGAPLADRRGELEDLLVNDGAAVVVGMQTDDLDVGRAWVDQLAAVGMEGIVAKRAREPYRPGARSWMKVKHYATTDAIVSGVTGPIDWPESLVLGRIHPAMGSCTSSAAAPNCTRRPPNNGAAVTLAA